MRLSFFPVTRASLTRATCKSQGSGQILFLKYKYKYFYRYSFKYKYKYFSLGIIQIQILLFKYKYSNTFCKYSNTFCEYSNTFWRLLKYFSYNKYFLHKYFYLNILLKLVMIRTDFIYKKYLYEI